MRLTKKALYDIQEINHQIDILLDLAKEKPTEGLLKSIRSTGKKIKTVTEKYVK